MDAVDSAPIGESSSSSLLPIVDKLCEEVVHATSDSGAVRHGAECFNYYFPQELDEDYLVVWEGFDSDSHKQWEYMNEDEMRAWLLKRVAEGYSFPLNPVWPVRDPGWYDVFKALLEHEHTKEVVKAWFPQESGLIEKMGEIHREFPKGFEKTTDGVAGEAMRKSFADDLDNCEKTDLATHKANKKGWELAKRKIAGVMRMRASILGGGAFGPGAGGRSPR